MGLNFNNNHPGPATIRGYTLYHTVNNIFDFPFYLPEINIHGSITRYHTQLKYTNYLLIFIGKNRLGELLMKLRTELRTTPTHTPSVTTEPRLRRSSSVGRLTTPISSIIIDEITYEANDNSNFLSNCYRASFKLDGKEWPTVLHYFVAKKFDLKKHHVSKILSLKSCEEVHLYSRNSSQSVS